MTPARLVNSRFNQPPASATAHKNSPTYSRPRELLGLPLAFRFFQTAQEREIQNANQPTNAAANAICKAPTESFTMTFLSRTCCCHERSAEATPGISIEQIDAGRQEMCGLVPKLHILSGASITDFVIKH